MARVISVKVQTKILVLLTYCTVYRTLCKLVCLVRLELILKHPVIVGFVKGGAKCFSDGVLRKTKRNWRTLIFVIYTSRSTILKLILWIEIMWQESLRYYEWFRQEELSTTSLLVRFQWQAKVKVNFQPLF